MRVSAKVTAWCRRPGRTKDQNLDKKLDQPQEMLAS